MNKLFFIIILFVPFFINFLGASTGPNIVIIVCDDLNDTVEGFGGHSQAYTPNINRIAEAGVKFTNAASNAPICGPSRASMWSGILPLTSGMYGKDQQNNQWRNNVVLSSKDTLFETFIDQGYYSYATGKIHHNGHEGNYSSIMRNTDGTVGFENQGKYGTYNNKPGGFGPYPNNFSNPVHNGVDPHWWPQSYKNRASPPYSGFGAYRDLGPYGGKWTNQTGGSNNASFTTWNTGDLVPDEICAAQAVNFINSYNENKPFLLTIGFVRPHSPYYAPEKFFEPPYVPNLNDIDLAPMINNDYSDIYGPVNSSDKDLAQSSGWYKYTTYKNMGLDQYSDPERCLKEWTQAYLACVAFVDEQVGKVLDAIEESTDPNIRDNTYVIFTSDHGYHLGEKEYIFKMSPWEESCKVPFVVSGPGVAAGEVCTKPISLVDIYPTCIDIAQINEPHVLDGNSIKDLLEDPINGYWAGVDFSASGIGSTASVSRNQRALPNTAHWSIRTEQYRFIHYRDGTRELYDHINDPHGWYNIYNSVSSELQDEMYTRYQMAIGAIPLPPPPPRNPLLNLINPSNGEIYNPLQSVSILAEGNSASNITSTSFYANGELIKTDGVAPFSAVLYDLDLGSVVISAIGLNTDSDGSQSSLSSEVTISVENTLNAEDSDADGLADEWELENFGNLLSNQNQDSDSDGASNLDEYRSGTDPNQNFSIFKIYQLDRSDSDNSLVWLGSSDKTYRILATDQLQEVTNWQVIDENIQGAQSTVNFWNENSLLSNRFYKVEIDD